MVPGPEGQRPALEPVHRGRQRVPLERLDELGAVRALGLVDRLRDHALDVDFFAAQHDLAFRDARHVEQIVDQTPARRRERGEGSGQVAHG